MIDKLDYIKMEALFDCVTLIDIMNRVGIRGMREFEWRSQNCKELSLRDNKSHKRESR